MYKLLIAFALTLFAASAAAQIGQQALGTPYNEVWVRNFIYSDSGMRAFTPLPDTAFGAYVSASHKNGTTALVGGVPYVYYNQWIKIATGTAGSGTVTNVATGLGLSGGPITTTGTIVVDTASAVILSRQRADNTYLKITDTPAMLVNYMLADFANVAGSLPQGNVIGLTSDLAQKQPLDADLTAIAALTPSNDDFIQRKAGVWTNRSVAQVQSDLGIPQTNISGNAATATALQTARTIGIITGDATSAGSSFDGTANNTNALTLATVNSNVGTFGSSTSIPSLTVNAKGLITGVSGNAVIAPAGTLTGATLASNVLASSLTSVGTLATLTVTAPISGSVTGNAGTVTTNANLTGPITSVGNATAVASQTGTGSTFAMAAGPTFTNPVLGNATATTLNTGTTLNGTAFIKSTNNISNVSNNHALTVGGEATGLNMALGTYSTGVGIQARNNGNNAAFYLCPEGGSDIHVGSSFAGTQSFFLKNTDAGASSFATFKVMNGATVNDAVSLLCTSSGFTPSGGNLADATTLAAESGLSGGLSIIVKNSAATFRVYTNNTGKRLEIDQNGAAIFSGPVTASGGGIGYSTGAGGTVTQGTSRTTTVVNNKLCGTITMFSAAQAADAAVTFTLTNSFIAATDYLAVQHKSATNGGAWQFSTVCGAGSATITIRNVSTGSITEATPLQFILFKSVNN